VLVDKKIVKLIEEGRFNDPFSILGKHKDKFEGKEVTVLRTYQPDAVEVIAVLDGKKKSAPLKKYPDSNLFEIILEDDEVEDYSFQVSYEDGTEISMHDPYAFEKQIPDFDLQIWGEGNHRRAYTFMGSHPRTIDGVDGVLFVVCAPSASRVSVVGDFNVWDGRRHVMRKYIDQGLWEIFIPGLKVGTKYKYEIASPYGGPPSLKSDPYGFYYEKRPQTASVVQNIGSYDWQDEDWIEDKRANNQRLDGPVSVYEVHLGSWKRKKPTEDDEDGFLTYRELAETLIPYVKDMGYTHIELLPIAEHPYDPSWGYQITGYFAPTSRFGTPQDFKYFIDECHKAEIGVLIDWVPAHFTKDDHGLRKFDGTALYEHADPRQGEHKDWGTKIFNFGRTEVMNFLISNAVFWFDEYHIDGIRVDAVASMLYLDYSREDGEWIPNKYGGRENLEAIEFLKRFNSVVHQEFPGIVTMAEESTAWPMVSRPTDIGGLGFDFKWNMGWMNDTLKYIEVDPIFRKYHQNQLTFSMIYAFTENFILPFSHDEVVHGKRSMLSKMPGDDWQKKANLRLLYTYMYVHPGKKLLFMGCEFGQWQEWNAMEELHWEQGNHPFHAEIRECVTDLNKVYKQEPALFEVDYDWEGFEWIDFSDADNSVISFLRYGKENETNVVCAFNFTPTVHHSYRVGVPEGGTYTVLLNSDLAKYGGSDAGEASYKATKGDWQGQPYSIEITLPPLAGIILKKK
jgi:1,4-alpha-glucan branching enzyme